MMFCCFKQKTAYDLLISDWSSDVCSSDLRLAGHLAMDLDHWDQAIGHFERVRRRIGDRDVVVLRELARAWAAKGDDTARKSGVLGKSVSVSVDLGGRRYIKKNTDIQSLSNRILLHYHTR